MSSFRALVPVPYWVLRPALYARSRVRTNLANFAPRFKAVYRLQAQLAQAKFSRARDESIPRPFLEQRNSLNYLCFSFAYIL